MAVSWGSAKGSGTKFRVGVDLKIPTPGVSDTEVTATVEYWIWTKDKVDDSSVTLTKSGNATNAGSVTVSANTPSNSDWSKSNKKLVRTETKVFVTSGADQILTATASMTGVNAAGASTVAAQTVKGTLKKSPLITPDAPTAANRTRNSDTSQTITWTNTNPNDSKKKYLGILIQRWDNVQNKWYDLKRLGVVTSFTDTTTIPDREYQYRVLAFNGGGQSGWATTSKIQTSPAAPIRVTASRPNSDVIVAWENVSTIATSFKIRHYEDGVDKGIVATGIAATASTWAHSGASLTAAHSYRVIAVASLEGPASALSGALPKAGEPYAPTGLAPNGTIHSVDESIRLTWQHSSADGSSQTGRFLYLREAGTESNIIPASARRTLSATANAATDQLTVAAHYCNTGYPVVLTGGTPPAPLALGVTYYAIVDSASLMRLALDEEDAEDGVAINITSAGAGVTVSIPVTLSNEQGYTLPSSTLPPGRMYEWTAATKGAFSAAEPMSPQAAWASFRTAATPTATLAFPLDGDTTMSPQAMVAWAFFSPDEGVVQQWWQASLWEGSAALESAEGEGEWDSYTFGYQLANGGTYRVEVIVEGSNGIRSSVVSATFTPEFIGPLAPGVELTWNADDGYVEIDITNPTDDDAPDASKVSIEHSLPGDEWKQIAKDVPPDTTVIDFLPTPNTVNNYRVRAVSSDGAVTVSTASINCDNHGDWYWLNGGPAFDVIAKARYTGGADIDLEMDHELHEFAGRKRPVRYDGTIVRQGIEISAQFPRDSEGYQSMAEFERLVRTPGLVYYRDPVGRRVKCSLSKVSFSDSDNLIDFTAKLEESD